MSAEIDSKYSQLSEFIDGLKSKDGALIAVLHKAQQLYGYLEAETQRYIAKKLSVPTAKVYGVVTFYSLFSMEKKGKYKISVCTGTACFVRGASAVVEELENQLDIKVGQTSSDGMFSLDCLRCVGACGLAPVVMINDRVYGRVSPEDVREIVDETLKMEGDR